MSELSTLTELRIAAYRRILPIVVLAFVASTVVPARLGIATWLDAVATPLVGALFLALWALAMLGRVSLRALDLNVQLVAGAYLLTKALYVSWAGPGIGSWEYFESAIYLPVYFSLIFWANDRLRAWRASWGFLAAFLLLAMPYLFRTVTVAGSENLMVVSVHLHVLIVAALTILFLNAYGQKEHVHVRSRAEAEVRARTDSLTTLDNRGGLEQRLEECRHAFERHDRPFSVILTDIDRFKRVNDEHGHNVGDEVLREFARALRARVRGEDHVGRWGGEEFAVVLPRTRLEQTVELAEQLRLRVREASYSNGVSVTASFGVAEFREGDSIDTLIGRADAALYAAKREGRDRVCVEVAHAPVPDARRNSDVSRPY